MANISDLPINFELLEKKPRYLYIPDLLEIFQVTRPTIRKYETYAINGFPASTNVLGRKVWEKEALIKYREGCFAESRKKTKIMMRGRVAEEE